MPYATMFGLWFGEALPKERSQTRRWRSGLVQ